MGVPSVIIHYRLGFSIFPEIKPTILGGTPMTMETSIEQTTGTARPAPAWPLVVSPPPKAHQALSMACYNPLVKR